MTGKHRSLLSLTLVAFLALAWMGCDSADPDDEEVVTDAEIFVGTWTVSQVSFDGSPAFSDAILSQFSETEAVFNADGNFEGLVVEAEDGDRREARANYTVNENASVEDAGTITFTGDAFEEAVTLDYTIESNDRIVLSSEDTAFLVAFAGISPDEFNIEINSFSIVLSREG